MTDLPQWQPISMLPTLAELIDDMVEGSHEQRQNFLEVLKRPHILDDYTVQRALNLYQTQLEDLPIYSEQLERWQKETLTTAQRKEVVRLEKELATVKTRLEQILALLDEIKHGTIDKIMAKSDLELGLDALLNPAHKPPIPRKPSPAASNPQAVILPDGVTSVRKSRPDGGVSYEFVHKTLGGLGQISAIPVGTETELRVEVAQVNPKDPTSTQRVELFEQIAHEFETKVFSGLKQAKSDLEGFKDSNPIGNVKEAAMLYAAFINVESSFEMDQLVRKLSDADLDKIFVLAQQALRGASPNDRIAIKQRLDDLQRVRTSPPTYSPLVGWIHDFVQATTDDRAKKILRDHPELLTDEAEREWEQFWAPDPAAQMQINRRKKLWRRAYDRAKRKRNTNPH